jgi:hypothetical protein
VPEKVTECYCGRKRQPGDGPDQAADRQRSGAGILWLGLLALLAVAGGTVAVLRAPSSAPRPATSPLPPDPVAAPRERSAPSAFPTPLSAPATLASPVPQAAAAMAAPSPEPRPTPTPSDSVDARREQGRLAFELVVQNLRGRCDVLERRLSQLDASCPDQARNVVGCDGLRRQIASDAQDIQAATDQAEERARRSWVDPGVMRQLRERHGLKESDIRELFARVEEALQR